MRFREPIGRAIAMTAAALCVTPVWAQAPQDITPVRQQTTVLLRPYQAPFVPSVRLHNSSRIENLIRGGKLYLTVQDAIALALENNIDLESARYNPLMNEWNLELYSAGGALPGVPSGSSQAGSVASGQGVNGSQAAAGVSTGGFNSNSNNSANATISQIGPVTPSLDPTFQVTQTFAHKSFLQPNEVYIQEGQYNIIDLTRNNTTSITEGLITGGQVSATYKDSYLNENAVTDLLNPSSSPTFSLSIQHNFLQGFGRTVNSRNIIVAKNTLAMSDTVFKGEVISVIANVLTLYYGLVADYEDVKAKQSALDVAQKFYEDNKKQVQIGTMAPLDVTTAEAQVASSQQDLTVSQTTLQQQQVSLKNVLSRDGLADPLLAEVDIVPLDRIEIPEKDNFPPLKDLLATARANRTDLIIEAQNLKNSEITATGTANGVRPQLAGLASASAQGLSGDPREVPIVHEGQPANGSGIPTGVVPCTGNPKELCEVPNSYFIGGIGTALGQVFRRNFPTERAGAFIAPVLRNRSALADATIDQLTIRQNELQLRKDQNQLVVDVSNQVIGLQQARVRYEAAVRNRVLEQQLLDAEQKKFSLGASTTYNVVQQQRDLVAAQSSEVAALVAYSNARVSFDQTLGTTLENNHVTLQEALSGHVSRLSAPPANPPANP